MELKKFRLKNHKSQLEVANLLGVARNTYFQYENELRNPTPDTLIKLADIFNCTTDDLLGRIPQQNLFDNARIPKTEIQTLFDQLNIVEQGKAIGYIESMLESRGINVDLEIK